MLSKRKQTGSKSEIFNVTAWIKFKMNKNEKKRFKMTIKLAMF